MGQISSLIYFIIACLVWLEPSYIFNVFHFESTFKEAGCSTLGAVRSYILFRNFSKAHARDINQQRPHRSTYIDLSPRPDPQGQA